MKSGIAEVEVDAALSEESRADLRLRYFCYATLVVVLVIFAIVRVRLRNMPARAFIIKFDIQEGR